ncbi:hypothetical protein AHAS_Ahas12G0198900 [Arachis hypogaea]
MGAPGRIHKVLFDPDDKKIQCNCSMWNSEGIPCSHIFCVMKYEDLEQISDSLIMRRWCKDAKDSRWMPLTTRPRHEGRMLRVYERADGQPGMSVWCVMKDPVVARTKGAPKRAKEFDQSSQPDVRGKRRCCTKCGISGHTKRTCSRNYARGVSGVGNGVSPTCGNGSHHGSAAASASLPTELDDAYERGKVRSKSSKLKSGGTSSEGGTSSTIPLHDQTLPYDISLIPHQEHTHLDTSVSNLCLTAKHYSKVSQESILSGRTTIYLTASVQQMIIQITLELP